MKIIDEYHHPIWINESQLSLDFHLVSSYFAYHNSIISRWLQGTALRFHYASLTPTLIGDKKIKCLAFYLERLMRRKSLSKWIEFCKSDIPQLDLENLRTNWNNDIQLLRFQVEGSKGCHCLVYRKSVPDGIAEKAGQTLRCFEKFIRVNNER